MNAVPQRYETPEEFDPEYARHLLVTSLRRMGIGDETVLAAMEKVERHRFVPPEAQGLAYLDGPLEIGFGQTISQPYMVAAMTEALAVTGGSRVLEVGTGSGYQTAILAELAAEVVTVERIAELSRHAAGRLADMGYDNVTAITGDGTLGAPEHGPFDAILVTAGAPDLPAPLAEQLKPGGRLVIPEGDLRMQTLVRYTKTAGTLVREALMRCMFVPLIGRHGWEH